MFNLNPSSKRAKLALRFFTYGVMTVTTIVLTTIVVFIMLGYRLDRNLNFSQGGLVQFLSSPNGADISIDGQRQNIRTPNKANLSAGSHRIGLSLAGYQPWHKTIELVPGQLLWLNYTRLLPQRITTANLHSFDRAVTAVGSPDHRWLLVQLAAGEPAFTLIDVSNEKKPEYTDFQLPDSLFTKKDNKLGTFEIIEWDLGSHYVLLKHQNGDMRELIRFDRSKPNEAMNLTRIFSLNISEAHFSATNPNMIFAKTDDVLRRLDLGNTSASAALVPNLKQFMVYGESTVAFASEQERVAGDPASRQQLIGLYQHEKITPVRTLPVSQPSVVTYSEYDHHGYMALGSTDSSRIDILRDPAQSTGANDVDLFARLDLGAPLSLLNFSNNGRMLLAQHGSTMATYDLEEAKAHVSAAPTSGSSQSAPMRWLDNFYLWTDANNRLALIEFDGQNGADITTVTPGFTALLSQNGRALFSFARNPSDGKIVLQSSKLTID